MNVPFEIFKKVALNTPDLFFQIISENIRSKLWSISDYKFGKGYSFKPKYVAFKLTHRCNLRCKMCGQWGEKGNYLNASKELLSEELNLEIMKKILDECSSFKPMIYLWGGEPFLYSNFKEMITYARDKKLNIVINTNGTLLERDAEFLISKKISNLLISIDGPEKIHNEIRGADVFKKILKGVEVIRNLKKKLSTCKPYLTMVYTLTDTNYHYLLETLDMAAEIGFDFVGVQFSTFTTKELGQKHLKYFEKNFSISPESWKGFISEKASIDTNKLSKLVKEAKRRKYPFATYFVPDLKPEEVMAYYNNPEDLQRWKKCIMPWFMINILPNGDLYPCIDFPDYIAGNIKEKGLLQIWNDHALKKFRKVLQKGFFPICYRCSGRAEF